jgi:cytidine deaminase
MTLSPEWLERMTDVARTFSLKAYCPYSRFRVGAAVLDARGNLFAACNVENASYGLTICAERSAIFSMVARGVPDLQSLVLYTPTRQPNAPCGSCRQVMFEFGPDAEVICVCDGPDIIRRRVRDLLPDAFDL